MWGPLSVTVRLALIIVVLFTNGCADQYNPSHPSDDDVGEDNDTSDDGSSDDDALPDLDGDGYTQWDDCNDDDPTIHPNAPDPPCDGVDHDCDGAIGAQIGGNTFDSIQAAIDSASNGDTIEACPGVHHERLELISTGELHQLTLTSLSGDAEDTILDGMSTIRLLEVVFVDDLMVTDLTFCRGNSQMPENPEVDGGAILATETGLAIQNCQFFENQAAHSGGAVAVTGWNTEYLSVSASTFEANVALTGGGISVDTQSDITIEVDSCTFTENQAEEQGGGFMADTRGNPWMHVVGSQFEDNTAGYSGGGLSVAGNQDDTFALVVEDSTFIGNYADHSGGAADLGAWEIGDYSFIGTTFDSNVSTGIGGALNLGTWGSAALALDSSTFMNNATGSHGQGGALYLGGWATSYSVDLTEVVMNGNSAEYGAGIWCSDEMAGDDLLIDLVITGGAITVNGHSGVRLGNNTTLESTVVDWGEGPTDNTPADIHIFPDVYFSYGTAATFSCTGVGGCN